jgi:hypothetical protein
MVLHTRDLKIIGLQNRLSRVITPYCRTEVSSRESTARSYKKEDPHSHISLSSLERPQMIFSNFAAMERT